MQSTLKRLGDVVTIGRSSRTVVVFAASLVTMVLIGTVFALLTDTVTLAGGYAESNDWNGDIDSGADPAGLFRVKHGECESDDDPNDPTVFLNDPVVSFGWEEAPLDLAFLAEELLTGPNDQDVFALCVFNGADIDATLYATVLTSRSAELGDCQPAEAAGELALGMSGCSDGEAGELGEVVNLQFETESHQDAGAEPNCTMLGQDLSLAADQVGLTEAVTEIAAGTMCTAYVGAISTTFDHSDGVDEWLLAALSDSVTFDLALDLAYGTSGTANGDVGTDDDVDLSASEGESAGPIEYFAYDPRASVAVSWLTTATGESVLVNSGLYGYGTHAHLGSYVTFPFTYDGVSTVTISAASPGLVCAITVAPGSTGAGDLSEAFGIRDDTYFSASGVLVDGEIRFEGMGPDTLTGLSLGDVEGQCA